jgi:hypothetical protein
MPHSKRYEIRVVVGEPPEDGPWPLEPPILITDDDAEARNFADSKRTEFPNGLAVIDRIASTVVLVNSQFSAEQQKRLSSDPIPLIPRYFKLREI